MIQELLKECQQIQAFMEITMSENPSEVTERAKDLAVYMARTGKMLADAKQMLNRQKSSEIMRILKDAAKEAKASSTSVNELIKSCCHETQYLVDWIERLNRTATHQMGLCQTLLANHRAEMNMNAWGGGGK
jgi:hypothetical protein